MRLDGLKITITGKLEQACEYDANGKEHGPHVENFEDGSPCVRGQYAHGD